MTGLTPDGRAEMRGWLEATPRRLIQVPRESLTGLLDALDAAEQRTKCALELTDKALQLHAAVVMDTEEDRALHARAVDAFAKARAAFAQESAR